MRGQAPLPNSPAIEQFSRQGRQQILTVVLGYAGFAALWIALSDIAVDALVTDPNTVVAINVIKGWLFVVVTALLLFGLVRRMHLRLLDVVRREEQLQREKLHSFELVNAIAQSSDDAIFAKDITGRYILFNRAAGEIVGKAPHDVIGHDDHTLFPPAQAAMLVATDREILVQRRILSREERLDTAQGHRIFQTTKGPLHGLNGDLIGTFGISRDVTERRQESQRYVELAERQQALLRALPDLVWVKDPDGHYLACNPRFEAYFGAPEAKIIGKSDTDFVDAETARQFMVSDMVALKENRAVSHEVEVRFAVDGHTELLQTIKTPLYDSAGRLIGVLGIARNISSIKAAEASLRAQAAEIAERNRELERFNRMMVGRELDMIALKREVNGLARQLGLAAPYHLEDIDQAASSAPDPAGRT